MRRISGTITLTLFTALTGCRQTYGGYLRQHAAEVTAVRGHLQSIRQAVQSAPPAAETPSPACPRPLTPNQSDGFARIPVGNTEMYLADDLEALQRGDQLPNRQGLEGALTSASSHGLATVLHWNATPSRTSIDDRTQMYIDQILRLQHLVVVRPRPVIPGQQWVDVYVTDLSSGRIECAFAIVGRASTESVGETYDRLRVNSRTGERTYVNSVTVGGYQNELAGDTRHAFGAALREHLGVQ